MQMCVDSDMQLIDALQCLIHTVTAAVTLSKPSVKTGYYEFKQLCCILIRSATILKGLL